MLLPLLYVTSSLLLAFPTHHKGQSQEHCSVTTVCNELSLRYNHFKLDLTSTGNVTSHAFKNYAYLFQPLFPILIFELILPGSCSSPSSPPQAGEYNSSVILLTVESYCIWDCYWRAMFFKVKLRLGGLPFNFNSVLPFRITFPK